MLLVCDHASNRIPTSLGTLGLSEETLATHIAWDIGAAEVARHLSQILDATLILSGYSRLVVDCNRPPDAADSTPAQSGGVSIPGNLGLSATEREERQHALFRPYHAAIAAALDARTATRPGLAPPTLLSIHSFTPELLGQKRPWPIAMLYGNDARLAHAYRDRLSRDPSVLVGDNEPYRVSPESDYTIPVHGEARGILHTAFEIRQDGVSSRAGAQAWAERIAAIHREIEL